MSERRVALVTGASSGIGAASSRALAAAGFDVVVGARRTDRVEALAAELGGGCRAVTLDVTDQASVDAAVGGLDRLDVLVNSAGGAKGLDPVAEADEDDWRWMWEVNVLGVMRTTRAALPLLEASGDGLVLTIGSVASFEPYAGGGGYHAAKYANRGVMDALRIEVVGTPIRVTQIDPGMVQTDFSTVRFGGDAERAAKVYQGVTPLTPDDVAEVVAFVATRPAHVDIDEVVVRPRDQARAWLVHRS